MWGLLGYPSTLALAGAPDFKGTLVPDFYRGRTVFRHWLPGVCYRDITFQLVSEARRSQNSHSDVTHTPLSHRTGSSRRTPN